LTNDAIIQALRDTAEQHSDALSLLQCERVQVGRRWHSVYSELPVEALRIDGPWQYVIRSRTHNPALPASELRSGTGWPGEFAVNGLVLLDHPEPGSSDGIVRTSLGLVTRIANERTRETLEHHAAIALYSSLMKR